MILGILIIGLLAIVIGYAIYLMGGVKAIIFIYGFALTLTTLIYLGVRLINGSI